MQVSERVVHHMCTCAQFNRQHTCTIPLRLAGDPLWLLLRLTWQRTATIRLKGRKHLLLWTSSCVKKKRQPDTCRCTRRRQRGHASLAPPPPGNPPKTLLGRIL